MPEISHATISRAEERDLIYPLEGVIGWRGAIEGMDVIEWRDVIERT
jgi:hypothetical protein